MTIAAKYRIELLGGIRVIRHEDEITRFRTQKTAALLAYLALHLRTSVTREQIAELFWPDLPLNAARNNLSTALSSLRSQLEPPGIKGRILTADNTQIGLNPEAIDSDVEEFERLLDRAKRGEEPKARAETIERAIELYRGDLLPAVYDDWAVPARQRLRERCFAALRDSIDLNQQTGRLDAAIDAVNRLIDLDPLDEESYLAKMRLLVAMGRRSAVREVLQGLSEHLQREVAAAPSQALIETANSLSVIPPIIASPDPVASQNATKPSTEDSKGGQFAGPPAPSPPARSNLPLQLTRFFGRDKEAAMLRSWLRPPGRSQSPSSGTEGDEAEGRVRRLVTITGAGGAGKTRLALECASKLTAEYGGKVYFVGLAEIPDAGLLSYHLSHVLNTGTKAPIDPTETLASLREDGPVLLVLDNFEHLIRDEESGPKNDAPIAAAAAAWVHGLLDSAPQVSCMVTSKRALGLRGEQELPLASLGMPKHRSTPNELSSCASVQLYVDRARMVKPDFAVTSNNADAVAELCLRLEGMPLAIELAAAWARSVTPVKMLERLSQRLDVLSSRQRDLPARHRSMRAVCEWSYALLTPALRRAFERLSVFRSGFDLEAAEAVCGPNAADEVQRLQEHSLIVAEEQPNGGIRFRMLEALHQFAAEMLAACSDADEYRNRHAAHFAALMKRVNDLYLKQREWVSLLISEYQNIRAALLWYMACDSRAGLALELAGDMNCAWNWSGESAEGRRLLRLVLADPANLEPSVNRAEALNTLGSLSLNQADASEARRCYAESLTIYRQIGTPSRIAGRLYNLGLACSQDGEYEESRKLTEEAIAILGEDGEPLRIAAYRAHLGVLAQREHNYASAREHLEFALIEQRKVDDIVGYGDSLTNLGNLCYRLKDYDAALRYYEEAVRVSLETGLTEDVLYAFCGFAAVAMDLGDPARAVRLYSAFESGLAARGRGLPKEYWGPRNEAHERLRATLGDAEYQACLAEGKAWRIEQAVDYALRRDAVSCYE